MTCVTCDMCDQGGRPAASPVALARLRRAAVSCWKEASRLRLLALLNPKP